MGILSELSEFVREKGKTSVSMRIDNMTDSFRLSVILSTQEIERQMAFLAAFMKGWREFSPDKPGEIELLFADVREIPTHNLCWYEPLRGSQIDDESTFVLAYYLKTEGIPALHFCRPLCTLKVRQRILAEMKTRLTAGMKAHKGGHENSCTVMYV